jgi:S-adenosylmethionine:tRNA ribosyltransferase-isomerase
VIPARWPREEPLLERLLHVDPQTGALRDARIGDLPSLLRRDDVLVVNDAATLPGSLRGRAADGTPLEARILLELPGGAFRAVLFDGADWRTPTEHRAPPPFVAAGTRIDFGEVSAEVERVAPLSARLVELRFDRTGAALWSALYRIGRPVQYSHAAAPLELWHVQVGYASRPWAAEMPSAGRPLRWELLLALRRRGVRLASITHAAGLSATGDPAIDAALPMAERFEVPPRTAGAVAEARDRGGRVVAVGTSVVRALEGAASVNGGELRACSGETDLLLGPGYQPRVVGGLLTGVHERGASHYALLRAFAPDDVLARASAHAEAMGYLSHEFGDSWLILGATGTNQPALGPARLGSCGSQQLADGGRDQAQTERHHQQTDGDDDEPDDGHPQRGGETVVRGCRGNGQEQFEGGHEDRGANQRAGEQACRPVHAHFTRKT